MNRSYNKFQYVARLGSDIYYKVQSWEFDVLSEFLNVHGELVGGGRKSMQNVNRIILQGKRLSPLELWIEFSVRTYVYRALPKVVQ